MIRTRTARAGLLATAALFLVSAPHLSIPARAQTELALPRVSPSATVTQTIGLTNLKVTYSRPGVKGRAIWGGLVPMNEVWRTGANEATTFETSDAITVAGQKLPAGSYSFFTIPANDEWTIVFSNAKGAWGSFDYSEKNDALRVKVKPGSAPHEEWMSFSFDNLTPTGGELALRWEKVRVAIPIQVDVTEKALANSRAAVAAMKADDWRTPFRAAQYFFNVDQNVPEATQWAEKSVSIQQNYFNMSLLADMQMKAGKTKEAIATAEKAVQIGKADKDKPDTRPTEKKVAEWKQKTM
ncbi:MAG TPA: DUF2911 domain-containing protein [Candidatus Eisenbacteria bacterium]|nr:DUF2911 domain-containing protein [Candidatus Eisenbacteria bacterium]